MNEHIDQPEMISDPIARAHAQFIVAVVETLGRIENRLATILDNRIPREWLTVTETSELLQVSETTIDRLISSGQLKASVITTPAGRGFRNRYRIRAEWIDKFLLANMAHTARIERRRSPSYHEFIK